MNFSAILLALTLTMVLSVLSPVFSQITTVHAADSDNFSSDSFYNTWQRTDYPVASVKTARSWYWGPKPLGVGFFEDYTDTKPNGKRLVQYFDKARMEINDPSRPDAVTNGLLVVEMITGRLQKGDYTFEDKGSAINIPIAGDPDNTWPTYGGLARAYNVALNLKPGANVLTGFNKDGNVPAVGYQFDPLTKIATVQNSLGIPQAFWEFLNKTGSVYNNGDYKDEVISNWLFSTGLPITEAYWTKVKVAGQVKDVMFQAFERRVLTYTPTNPEGFKVEMGNVGAHYVNWRYQNKLPELSDPLTAIFVAPQPDWYEVKVDGLNVRTGPGTSFPNPVRGDTLPYLTTLYSGNHIQAIKEVKGEKLEGNNDIWYQFYQDPDLFVYSGFTKKLTLPDMPASPRTHTGLWVSVSLDKQMMAVYENKKLLYRTYIASGVPSDVDPAKDHRTPKGVYKIDGSYRPKSQTMQGDASDRANPDYYKLDNIRNVSYFYQDYSIHGTYWHARFGTYPQSHGCVNATVYDAGLIFQLKAGTVVDVF